VRIGGELARQAAQQRDEAGALQLHADQVVGAGGQRAAMADADQRVVVALQHAL
jgi:hypothetical protein